MAVTGTFQADFSSFYDAVQKAEISLRSFESGSAKVEKQLDRMADSFSGRRIISEATLMSEAIERSGGVTKLTAAELARAGATAEEAADKMRRLGIEVPPGLQSVADAAKNANEPVGDLHNTFQKFDGVLAAMGVHIGPEVKGLTDLGYAAGKTASELGILATVGLTVGAAIGGWKIGKMIDEWTGLSKSIATGTAALLGWGDVAEQMAMAKADVIARAVANGASAMISYTDAIKFNIEVSKNSMAVNTDWTGRMESARKAILALTESTLAEIEVAKKLGATDDDLRRKYGLSADAVKLLDDRIRDLKAGKEDLAKAAEKLAKIEMDLSGAATMAATSHNELGKAIPTEKIGKTAGAIDTATDSTKKWKDATTELNAAQAVQNKNLDEFIALQQKKAVVEKKDAAEKKDSSSTFDIPPLTGFALDNVIAKFHQAGDRDDSQALNRALSSLEGQVGRYGSIDSNREFFSMQKDQILLQQLRQMLPSGASVIPSSSTGGVSTNITINGSVLGSKEEIARVVGAAVMDTMRSQGFRAPVGA